MIFPAWDFYKVDFQALLTDAAERQKTREDVTTTLPPVLCLICGPLQPEETWGHLHLAPLNGRCNAPFLINWDLVPMAFARSKSADSCTRVDDGKVEAPAPITGSNYHVMKLMFCGVYSLILTASLAFSSHFFLVTQVFFFFLTKETGQYVKAH
jgi:hypothetical protein